MVRHVEAVKLTGRLLRDRVLKLLVLFPDIRVVLVETNRLFRKWSAGEGVIDRGSQVVSLR